MCGQDAVPCCWRKCSLGERGAEVAPPRADVTQTSRRRHADVTSPLAAVTWTSPHSAPASAHLTTHATAGTACRASTSHGCMCMHAHGRGDAEYYFVTCHITRGACVEYRAAYPDETKAWILRVWACVESQDRMQDGARIMISCAQLGESEMCERGAFRFSAWQRISYGMAGRDDI
eukprot:CAMPEP_0181244772 /NCGR_PEP_ID=MMETSP1096-20121128/43050_1 /TAXON_ID=156174 ORGANISM="Chrysochromulina ericina, Strain CCMP281" /NCGR_SAMPLE_ID=MMETSP1096 /ASSEMBLY_ACC=CAM_ASM_000453 /LENGTH=175 /DNA_ID=CAMNT_0023341367 /DNA_START=56 /DNA_END=582 /DNA_ORIENTATION=+